MTKGAGKDVSTLLAAAFEEKVSARADTQQLEAHLCWTWSLQRILENIAGLELQIVTHSSSASSQGGVVVVDLRDLTDAFISDASEFHPALLPTTTTTTKCIVLHLFDRYTTRAGYIVRGHLNGRCLLSRYIVLHKIVISRKSILIDLH